MKIITQIHRFIVEWFPLIAVFCASLYVSLDPDLGWHLKYGEYFFTHKAILRTNSLSTEMPDYRWTNSSWGTDLITYPIFQAFGFPGLTVAGALVITGICFTLSKTLSLSFWEKSLMFPLILILEEPFFKVSFRGQLMGILFLSILMAFLTRYRQTTYRIYLILIIPLMMIWANLHGSFILGVAVMTGYLTAMLICAPRRRLRASLLPVAGIAILVMLAGMINPFGWRVYQETVRHFANPLLTQIVEWHPNTIFSPLWWQLTAWSLLVFVSIWIIRSKKQLRTYLPEISISLVMIFLSFIARRYTWSMIILTIPLVRHFIASLSPRSRTAAFILGTAFLSVVYVYSIKILIPENGFLSMDWTRYCKLLGCSDTSASELIREQKPDDRTLTLYNWGGWLIWNYPDIKPSIDGRMHLWIDSRGYSAFAKYFAYEQNWIDIESSEYSLVYFSKEKPLYNRMKELVRQGRWTQKYEDDLSGIFRRNSDFQPSLSQESEGI